MSALWRSWPCTSGACPPACAARPGPTSSRSCSAALWPSCCSPWSCSWACSARGTAAHPPHAHPPAAVHPRLHLRLRAHRLLRRLLPAAPGERLLRQLGLLPGARGAHHRAHGGAVGHLGPAREARHEGGQLEARAAARLSLLRAHLRASGAAAHAQCCGRQRGGRAFHRRVLGCHGRLCGPAPAQGRLPTVWPNQPPQPPTSTWKPPRRKRFRTSWAF